MTDPKPGGPLPPAPTPPTPTPTVTPTPTPVTLDVREEVDLDQGVEEPPAVEASPRVVDYDPEPARDKVRGQIALYLIYILGGMVIASFLLLYAAPWHTELLVSVLQILFGPVTTLVGAATGYYFGANSAIKPK